MTTRRERWARARAINEKLWRLQGARLAKIESDLDALRMKESRLLDQLGAGALDPRLLLPQLDAVKAQCVDTETERQRQLAQLSNQGRRAKQTERIALRMEEDWRRTLTAEEMRRILNTLKTSAR